MAPVIIKQCAFCFEEGKHGWMCASRDGSRVWHGKVCNKCLPAFKNVTATNTSKEIERMIDGYKQPTEDET